MNGSFLDSLTPESKLEAEKMLLEMEQWRQKKSELCLNNENLSQTQLLKTKAEANDADWLVIIIAITCSASELALWLEENPEDEEIEENELPIDPKESARIEREIKAEDRRNAKLGLIAQQTINLSQGRVVAKLNRPLNAEEIALNRQPTCSFYKNCLDS
ncbi:MAG: hypothetical protein WCG01_01145, partial [bacterium]